MWSFVSWQSDHFVLRYNKLNIKFWKFKVPLMAKITTHHHIRGLEFKRFVCFSFHGGRCSFMRYSKLKFDLEIWIQCHSQNWPKSNHIIDRSGPCLLTHICVTRFWSSYGRVIDTTHNIKQLEPILLTLLTLTPAQISNYIHYQECHEITNQFLNFNGCTVEVWEWISDFISHLSVDVITYPYWDRSSTMLVKRAIGSKTFKMSAPFSIIVRQMHIACMFYTLVYLWNIQ